MLSLNDDCLINIFGKLKLRDQLRLTAVCERFRDIIVSVLWRSRFRYFVKHIDSETDALSRKEFQSLLKLIAHGIEDLFVLYDMDLEHIPTEYTVWRPKPAFYLRFKFPVLRSLSCYHKFNESDMQLMAANCPQIEELCLSRITANPVPYIVQMRHLRKLEASDYAMSARDLKQILTMLPLTKLWIRGFSNADDPRLLAEAVMGARDLQLLRIRFIKNTPAFMEIVMAMASTSERSYPLIIHIEEDDLRLDCIFPENLPFVKYQRSLQQLVDNKLPGQPRVCVEESSIEFQFFCKSNKNIT